MVKRDPAVHRIVSCSLMFATFMDISKSFCTPAAKQFGFPFHPYYQQIGNLSAPVYGRAVILRDFFQSSFSSKTLYFIHIILFLIVTHERKLSSGLEGENLSGQ